MTAETDAPLGPLHPLAGPLEWVSTAIDALSIAILLIGALRFLIYFVGAEAAGDPAARLARMNRARLELGRYILAGLELLIVSDVIHTALSLALEDIAFLGGLVAVRSVISFFLERELRGIEERRGGAEA